jgi:glycosyltransferase involved in cell wall biosynthesis
MNSESYVQQTLSNIGMNDTDTLDAIRLLSGHLDLSQLNALYNVADAYVTPYRAEGFNLPALEAQTCGTPVIATQGGATEDFLSEANCIKIQGTFHENENLKEDLQINAYVDPDLNHLIDVLTNLESKDTTIKPSLQLSWFVPTEELCKLLA